MIDPVILLDDRDNVVVARRAVSAGETFDHGGHQVTVRSNVDIGHKIAAVALEPGSDVIKYGMSIGSATEPIVAGDWVHVHNMKSNYLEMHLRPQKESDL